MDKCGLHHSVPWECLTGYLWNGQSLAQSGAKMSPLLSQYSQMFMTHLQNGMHMCAVDSAVEHIPRTWRKAAEKQEWFVGCPQIIFCFGSLQLPEKVQQHMSIYKTVPVQRIKPPKPDENLKGCRKAQVPTLSFSFFFSLVSTFRTSFIQHPSNFWRESSITVFLKMWSVGPKGSLGPFPGTFQGLHSMWK